MLMGKEPQQPNLVTRHESAGASRAVHDLAQLFECLAPTQNNGLAAAAVPFSGFLDLSQMPYTRRSGLC